ncbi:MAG TPA: carboxypeptidase regulatory-like domain-containing protein [Polyangia bacterium]|nr:carboxypeptidase regulatory-like domain-containing protein [Polyangia bacterium]
MTRATRPFAAVTLALAVAVAGRPGAARAETRPAPTAADFARLEKEVADQRQLIIQIMQSEQERYDILLKLLQGSTAARGVAAMPPLPAAPAGPAQATHDEAAASPAPAKEAATATVTGRVQARSGALKDAYVYVDLMRGSPARGKTLEIKQKDKQFSPRAAVVLRGTSVVFPNLDPVYHNVFSTSGRNSFDLGAYRAGETPRSVVLSTPGVVDVFCNIHSRMSASILVAPSSLYAKVNADGSFRLDNVPVGARKLVVWSPGSKPAQQKVEVTAAGGQATFVLEDEPATAHLNKTGQPYGSYKE